MKKIKSIATYMVADYTPEEGTLVRRELRDEKGSILLEESFTPDGGLEAKIERDYDEEGRLILEKEYAEDGVQIHQETVFQYSPAGRLTSATIKYQDGSLTIKNYEHDEKENSETISIVDEEGEYEGKEFRVFDSEGKVLREIIHDEDEKLEQDVTRSYDDNGYLLERITGLDDEYETVENFHYERNEKGQIVKRKVVDEEGALLRLDEFDYDENGNTILHKVQNINQGWAIMDSWEYDDKDRVIKSRRAQPNGTVSLEATNVYSEDGFLLETENRSSQGVHVVKYQYEFFD